VRGALIDAGPLVAALDADDSRHAAVVAALKGIRGRLTTVWPALTEAHHLLRRRATTRANQLLDAVATGAIGVADLGAADMPAILAVMRKFADQELQLADAALVHVAHRDGYSALITIDERDFRAVEASRRGRLKLIIPSSSR
jgi:predicted nucleic acid-binding protein